MHAGWRYTSICSLYFCWNWRDHDNIFMFHGVNLVFCLCSKSLLCENTLQFLRVVKKEEGVIPFFFYCLFIAIYICIYLMSMENIKKEENKKHRINFIYKMS